MRPLLLPQPDRSLRPYMPTGRATAFAQPTGPIRSRVAFAAAHVVRDPLGPDAGEGAVDWDATLAFRKHLWGYGLGVAEAMDTAQRGMGLDYAATRVLVERACAAARACASAQACADAQGAGGRIACGAGTDQLPPGPADLEAIVDAYEEQCAHVEACGGQVVLMASRQLAASARDPEDYARVFDRVLAGRDGPVIVHWLGPMFDPALEGYWGSRDLDHATEACLGLLAQHADRIDGIKLSLLDDRREVALRRRLPPGVRMYTGDDFHYPELILGDGEATSDALLGIFDAIAPAASAALQALDAGDEARFREVLAPTVPLSRKLFEAPTFHYKTGIVFLAYLNGFQDHFRMLGGLEGARGIVHLAEVFVLADAAGLLHDPDLASERMRLLLRLAGIDG